MRIAFVNPNLAHDYNVDTPFEAPLPGSESAQAYLALAMAHRGHEVATFTGTTRPGRRRGIAQERWTGALPGTFDAIFLTSAADHVAPLRAAHGETPIWAWQHNVFVPGTEEEKALKGLSHRRDRIVCVSNWHAANYKAYGVDGGRIDVLRNAIGPRFERLYEPGESVILHKRSRAAFTSVPYKGLRQALAFFKTVRTARPELVFDVFSSFDFYPPNNLFRHQPGWMMLQTEAKLTPGVVYHGNVPQPQLAEAMKKALMLFYPNVAAETSSIAVMEAMAAGCVVITTAMGALPETVGEHGILAPVSGTSIDPGAYVNAAVAIAGAFADDDTQLGVRLRQQVDWVVANYRWDIRAEECEKLIRWQS
jgi:glycosyltransferase involved in cell wall biosynthesis